ncbi:AMP-dependent synthetase and ligase, partial [Actinobacteria bacterium OV450]
MTVAAGYAAKPWLALLSPAQRAPVSPPPSLLHAFREAVARAPGRTALAYFDGRIGYAETDALSDSVAGHLAAHGVGRGDRVAVMLQNTPHFVLATLAAWKAGAVVVPLNPMYKAGEVGHILRDSGAVALLCEGGAWSAYLAGAVRDTAVRAVLTASDHEFQTRNDPRVFPPASPAPSPAGAAGAVPHPRTPQGGAAQGGAAQGGAAHDGAAHDGAAHDGAAHDGAAHDRSADDSSRQSGVPQSGVPQPGVRQSGASQGGPARPRAGATGVPARADLAAVARQGHPAPPDPGFTAADTALISYTSGTSGTPKGAMNPHGALTHNAVRQVTGHPLPEGATYFALAPLFHITGMVCELGACLANAGTLVLAHRFDAGVVLDAFLEHRPAYTVGPATAFMALAAHPDATRDHFASFRVISYTGAPLPP